MHKYITSCTWCKRCLRHDHIIITYFNC